MAAPPSSLEKRIHFHEMLQSGVFPEDLVQRRLKRHQQIIDQKIEQIAQALLGRQQETEKIIDDLIRELEVIDPLEAAKEQNEFLTRTIEKLQTIQKGLMDKLEPVERDIQEKQEIKNELQKTLHTLRGALSRAESKGDPLQSFLFTGSAKCNQYISKHTGSS